MSFTRLISHRAELKTSERKSSEATSGTDAALAALQSSLASYEQEKQAKQANITNSVLPTPKNRFDAARQAKLEKKRPGSNSISQPASPPLSAAATPRLGPAPTSVPASEESAKMRAMKTPVTHLLAMGPARTEEIVKKTHIPKADLDDILQKVGKQVEGKWQLTDRAYKDLDVWKFEYSSQDDRQAAIDNAVKAFDRMRLEKDEKLWQMLLPKEDRGKGIVLSRLHLGGGQMNRGLTPHYQPSPMPHVDGAGDNKLASGANTPHLGGSTPRPSSSKGDVKKRLLSKDPKKARAVEVAKEKKRKEREAAASDREGGKPAKKQVAKKTNSNIKSAEFVHSSEDESDDEGEVKESNKTEPEVTRESPKTNTKSRSRAVTSTSSDSSDTPIKIKMTSQNSTGKSKSNGAKARATASPSFKASNPAPSAEKKTPQKTANNSSLSAPQSQRKTQRSPHLSNGRPSVPSPLGAARPRVASDVSDRGAVGVQKVKPGAETPKGLGIIDGSRKRQDTVTSTESLASNRTVEKTTARASSEKEQGQSMKSSSTPTAKPSSGTNNKSDSGTKRKAEEDASNQHSAKHRKTDSGSSQSHKSHASSAGLSNGTARTSPNDVLDNNSNSDSSGSVVHSYTYRQGVNLAEEFRDKYYPAYAKLYDGQAAMEARGEKVSKEERERLLEMHKRLDQMKRDMKTAAQREHSGD